MGVIATKDLVVHDENLHIDRKIVAGTAIPPDLVEAYEQAGGTTDDAPDDAGARTLATQDVIVHDENLGIDRKIVAGTPIPPDLIDAYNVATGEALEVAAAPALPAADPAAAVDYGSKTVPEFEELAAARGSLHVAVPALLCHVNCGSCTMTIGSIMPPRLISCKHS